MLKRLHFLGLQPSSEGEGSEESSSEEDSDDDSGDEDDDDDDDENDEPLSLEWPETRRKQAVYLFLLPILFPLWTTVPDVRNPVRFDLVSGMSNRMVNLLAAGAPGA